MRWRLPGRSTPCRPARRRPGITPTERRTGSEVSVRRLCWRPTRRRTPIFDGLELDVAAGERVLVTGPSGAGKSTLLRALAGLLLTADSGELSGEVRIDGRPVAEAPLPPALVLQDPLAGRVADTVGRDVAFGLENLGTPRAEIWPLVRRALDAAAFPYPVDHPTAALSGGESQRLALAGAAVTSPRMLLLDEPSSMLDPAGSKAVRQAVAAVAERTGATVVLVEHRIDPWLDFVDRILVLDRTGRIVADGPVAAVLDAERATLAELGVWLPGLAAPTPVDIAAELVEPWSAAPPTPVRARGVWLERRIRLSGRSQPPVAALREVDAAVDAGRLLTITGPSGAGKSSLVGVLAGLIAPTRGSVQSAPELAVRGEDRPIRWSSRELAARIAWVPQFPEHGVVTRTVRDEVLVAATACGRDPVRAGGRAEGLLDRLALSHLAGHSPYHLSGGEQRRLMIAAALAHGPCAVFLDEPTVGQDRLTWAAVTGAMAAARDAGSAVAMSSHDGDAVVALGDDGIRLAAGAVVS